VNDVTLFRNCVTVLKTSDGIFALLKFPNNLKYEIMGNLLYIVAVILIIGWAI
jgi:hypothetical protein